MHISLYAANYRFGFLAESVIKLMLQNKVTLNQPLNRLNGNFFVSVGLWMFSMFLTVMSVFAFRELFLWGMSVILASPDRATQLRTANLIDFSHQCTMLIVGMAALAVMIGVSEYFFRHLREARTVRILFLIAAIEAAIVLPTWFLFWRS
jgi:hypothetical protein